MDQAISVSNPEWVINRIDWNHRYASDDERMELVLSLLPENLRAHTGGPFGAAVFESRSGELISVGVNRVVEFSNAMLHAPVVALMMACNRLGHHDLKQKGRYDLFLSCEPCAMCLWASLMGGVGRLAFAASNHDAQKVGFERGLVSDEHYVYLKRAGVEVLRNFRRKEAKQALNDYERGHGHVYNPKR